MGFVMTVFEAIQRLRPLQTKARHNSYIDRRKQLRQVEIDLKRETEVIVRELDLIDIEKKSKR